MISAANFKIDNRKKLIAKRSDRPGDVVCIWLFYCVSDAEIETVAPACAKIDL